LAVAQATRYQILTSLLIFKTRNGLELVQQIPTANLIDYNLSPNETFISVWTRYVKPTENDQVHRNMQVFHISSGDIVLSFTHKSSDSCWNVEWTEDEQFCAKLVSNELQFFDSSKFQKGVFSRLKMEGIESFSLSPGKRPVVSVFIAGKNGSPSSCQIYDITNFSAPLSRKSFFRADSVNFYWNAIGTNVLVFTHTDVDATGKSYYGETSLYFLSITGNFDCKVDLPHPGPIHDVAWSPNSKEFIVVYGSMPSKATLFDHRANAIYELGSAPRNTVKYSPTGRFFLIAGFGNLAGDMDIWERKNFKKLITVSASNSSSCEWSPDGRFIMTAILYRRLKVDNGIKLWHYTGTVVHTIEQKEMYQVQWRPETPSLWPEKRVNSPIPTGLQPAQPVKAAGKYVPPSMRNSNVSRTVYDREAIDNGTFGKVPSQNNIPGKSNRSIPGKSTPKEKQTQKKPQTPTTGQGAVPGGSIDAEKKIRTIQKKLQQIQDLKKRRDAGDQLELTQISKIESEAALLKEVPFIN
jgi:translation initiation factor 2A